MCAASYRGGNAVNYLHSCVEANPGDQRDGLNLALDESAAQTVTLPIDVGQENSWRGGGSPSFSFSIVAD